TEQIATQLKGRMLKTAMPNVSWNTPRLTKGTSLTTEMVDALKTKAGAKPGKVTVQLSMEVLPKDLKANYILGAPVLGDGVNLGKGHKIIDQAEIDAVKGIKKIQKDTLKVIQIIDINADTTSNDLVSWVLEDDEIILSTTSTFPLTIPTNISLNEELAKEIASYCKSGGTAPKTIPLQGATPPYESIPVNLSAKAGDVKLCTNFSEFKQFLFGKALDLDPPLSGFPDPDVNPQLSHLIHAVYGFFNNGGNRCYVVLVDSETNLTTALEQFEAIDEIAMVVAPGISGDIATHCKNGADSGAYYRLAILDSKADTTLDSIAKDKPTDSDYAAFYYPWIEVFDPATKIKNPQGEGRLLVPPSGHMAGIYARVDSLRGVHKAPANEVVFGALGLQYDISKNRQSDLNAKGINCIRNLNGNIKVWGARTIGGNNNGEFKYINVRRLFLFLRHSIDQSTQWTVFEPNNSELWAKIRRNVNAFLTDIWRSGALFGNTPQEAFYVRCDETNNPPDIREQGQVIIEIGVAVVKPAEFVVFRLSQWAGPGS
ncbi:MAG: phage tail sheath family protein, partial [Microcystaceae cyanobacterium]